MVCAFFCAMMIGGSAGLIVACMPAIPLLFVPGKRFFLPIYFFGALICAGIAFGAWKLAGFVNEWAGFAKMLTFYVVVALSLLTAGLSAFFQFINTARIQMGLLTDEEKALALLSDYPIDVSRNAINNAKELLDQDRLKDRAVEVWNGGDLEKALRQFDEALNQYPNAPVLLLNRGNLQFERGNWEAAKSDLTNAQAIWPSHAHCPAYMNLLVMDEYEQFPKMFDAKPDGKIARARKDWLKRHSIGLKSYRDGDPPPIAEDETT